MRKLQSCFGKILQVTPSGWGPTNQIESGGIAVQMKHTGLQEVNWKLWMNSEELFRARANSKEKKFRPNSLKGHESES